MDAEEARDQEEIKEPGKRTEDPQDEVFLEEKKEEVENLVENKADFEKDVSREEVQCTEIAEKPDLDINAESSPVYFSQNNEDSLRPSSPRVVVSLKSEKKSPLNFEIADSLLDRNHQKELKISNLRLKQKLDELKEVRPIPEINKTFKKSKTKPSENPNKPKNPNKPGQILPAAQETDKNKTSSEFSKSKSEYLKKKTQKCEKTEETSKDQEILINYLSDNPESFTVSSYEPMPARDVVKSDQKNIADPSKLKDTIKLRENLKNNLTEPPKKKPDLLTRGKMLKEKKLKAQQEAELQRKNKEIQDCTFKPSLLTKNQVSDSGSFIIKRSLSGEMLKGPKDASSPKTVQKHVFEENFKLTPVALLPLKYSQVSPISVSVKYKLGYNEKHMLSKAVPMVDYRIPSTDLD